MGEKEGEMEGIGRGVAQEISVHELYNFPKGFPLNLNLQLIIFLKELYSDALINDCTEESALEAA